MRPSTYRGYEVLWREIKPFCEGLWTRDARTRHVQAILEAMAKTNRFNVNSLKHIEAHKGLPLWDLPACRSARLLRSLPPRPSLAHAEANYVACFGKTIGRASC
jgi:hypothetical protein